MSRLEQTNRNEHPKGVVNRSRMKKLVLVAPGGRVVCDVCHLANKPHTRLKGVIGWKQLNKGEGVLIRPTFSIHTAFVRFPLDAVFLDEEMKVVSIKHELKPWRLAAARKAKAVLELAAGESKRLGLESGDRLGWGMI
jgi:uncharacterized protein